MDSPTAKNSTKEMDSSSGTSSGGSTGLQEAMEQRKRKRMLSNRESARRSRQRKQKHLDDLTAQVGQLRKENGEILAALASTTHSFMAVDAENSVLRTRAAELAAHLHSLNGILLCMNLGGGGNYHDLDGIGIGIGIGGFFSEPWNQAMPMAASVDMFQHC